MFDARSRDQSGNYFPIELNVASDNFIIHNTKKILTLIWKFNLRLMKNEKEYMIVVNFAPLWHPLCFTKTFTLFILGNPSCYHLYPYHFSVFYLLTIIYVGHRYFNLRMNIITVPLFPVQFRFRLIAKIVNSYSYSLILIQFKLDNFDNFAHA